MELEPTDYDCPWCTGTVFVNPYDITTCRDCPFRRPKSVLEEKYNN